MTAYETVMVVLTSLAFIVSIIGIIVKLLLIIIDNSAKKLPQPREKFEIVISII